MTELVDQKAEKQSVWVIIMKFCLASYPFVIAWAVWMTVNQFEDNTSRKNYQTKLEAYTQMTDLKMQLSGDINKGQKDIANSLQDMSKEVAKNVDLVRQDLTGISTRLTKIETKLEDKPK